MTIPELEKVVSIITSYKEPNRVLLFGSRAHGQACPDSDYDLCVLYDALPKRNLEVMQDLYRILFPFKGHSIDLVVYEVAAFTRKALITGSFEAKISTEAKLIYCKG